MTLVLGIAAGRSSFSDDTASAVESLVEPPSASAARRVPEVDPAHRQNRNPRDRQRQAGTAQIGGIFEDKNRGGRTRAMLSMMDRLDAEGIAGLLEKMREGGLDVAYRDEYLLALSTWAERDPLAAAAHVREIGGDSDLQYVVMAAWAAADPASAERWAREVADAGTANPWLVGVIEGIAGSDVERARLLIEELPRGRERNRALDATLGHVFLQGGESAAGWINEVTDERIQRDGAEWLAERMADRDPEAAAAWVSSLESADARRRAAEEVASRYARHDLIAAKSWVMALPEETRLEAAEGVVDHLARENPAAAFHWSGQLGAGAALDGVRRDIVRRGFERDPAAALTIALHLEDDRARERFTSSYLQRWVDANPAAASGWMESHASYLPETTRVRLAEPE